MDMEFDYVSRWSPSPSQRGQCTRLLRVIYQKMRSLIVENKEQFVAVGFRWVRIKIISTNYMEFSCNQRLMNGPKWTALFICRAHNGNFDSRRFEWSGVMIRWRFNLLVIGLGTVNF